MHISTLFIKLAVISVVLLSACATQENKPEQQQTQAEADKALSKTSESDIQQYRQAISLISTGKLDEAESELMDFSADHPGLAGPLANLGLISMKRNKYDKAEEFLQKALSKNPNLPHAYNLLGCIEKSRGNIIKARDNFTRAVELKENYALAHYNLALLYDIYIQDISSAVAHYQKYLALIKSTDKKTADWLNELKASLKKG